MITAGSIKVYSQFSISSLLDMEIEAKEGCHSKLALRGFLLEGENRTEMPQDAIMITGANEEGNEEILFRGIIQETHVFRENGVSQIILTAASESMQLDKKKRSRSFQDISLSCAEVMRSIVSEYGGAIVCEDSSMKITNPMIQYEETDWEFCKRLAGRMGWGLFDCPAAAKPVIYVGLVEGTKAEFPEDEYHCCVDSEYYRHRGEGDIQKAEFLYYKVESERNYEIGDSAWYRRQKRYIFEKRAELKENVLKFSYKLGGKCRVMRREQPNPKIAGISLSGEVKKNEKETVYVKLDIDGKNGKAAYPYPWSPATGNLAYCMPQPGTKVYLYFQDCHEENAIAVHSEHQGSTDFGSIQNRGFATEHGKQLQLHADSMSFRSKTAKGEQLLILGQDKFKIKVGHGRTVITGKEKITFCAPVINLITPREINQYKVKGYALEREKDLQSKGSRNPATGGDSSFSVQFEFNGFAKQGVMAGTEYERYFAFKDEPTYEKDYATGWKILAGIVTAVAVGIAVGALVLATGGIAAYVIGVTVTQLAVGTGVITAAAGILATAGTYFNDKRNGTTSSISDYRGNAWTAAVSVGGSLEGLYLSLTGAEALTYLMTGGSVAVPVFGTVISTKDIMTAVMLASAEVSNLNIVFQLDDLRRFLAGEKSLRAPTGNQRYDASKAWTEMIAGYISTLGLQNPRTYGATYGRLPDATANAAANVGASGSTALVTQNTSIINTGGTSGAGSLALLPQMNAQAVTYASAIPAGGNSAAYPVGGGGGTVPDFYVGPNGKALPSQYKDWIGTNIQKELLNQAENPQLQNAIKQLYRGNSFIGDGGTADVIRFEQQTGLMLGKNGGSHVQKGIDMAKYIENKILTQDLSPSDRALATKLLEDLYSALGR